MINFVLIKLIIWQPTVKNGQSEGAVALISLYLFRGYLAAMQ